MIFVGGLNIRKMLHCNVLTWCGTFFCGPHGMKIIFCCPVVEV